MMFGRAERRKEHDNQLNDVAREANASSSSSSRFCLVPTKSVKPSMDLKQPEGLFPKMVACGRRNKIDWSLELDDLKNCHQHRRQRDDALARLSMASSRRESRSAAIVARARGSRGPLLLGTIVRANCSTMCAFSTISLMQRDKSWSILCKK